MGCGTGGSLGEGGLKKAAIIFLYYEETLGKTLEAIDEVFDGVRHTQVRLDVYQQFRRK